MQMRGSSGSAPDIRAQLARVPESPGVYLWKDDGGGVLYVGKAKALRRRMRQYVTGHDEREKIPVMMEQVTSFDYYVTTNEVESLILESSLIKQHKPPFNVNYRDDKSYPYIARAIRTRRSSTHASVTAPPPGTSARTPTPAGRGRRSISRAASTRCAAPIACNGRR
jgi:excinuclease UvrABC nuclease subunit